MKFIKLPKSMYPLEYIYIKYGVMYYIDCSGATMSVKEYNKKLIERAEEDERTRPDNNN